MPGGEFAVAMPVCLKGMGTCLTGCLSGKSHTLHLDSSEYKGIPYCPQAKQVFRSPNSGYCILIQSLMCPVVHSSLELL